MNILLITEKYIKQNIRRPMAFLLLVAGPIILILILGQSFSGMFHAGAIPLNMHIGYYSLDKGPLSNAFREFTAGLADSDISSEEITDRDRGEKMTAEGTFQAFIILNEKQQKLELILNNNIGMRSGIIESILQGFLNQMNFYNVILSHKPGAMESLAGTSPADYIAHSALESTRQPRAMDYFGIIILTMAIMFGCHLGSYGIIKEKATRTLQRIYTTPVKKIEFLLGTCLGSLLAVILQTGCVFLVSKYLMHIYYGETTSRVVILLFSECFFALAFGIGIASLLDDDKIINGIINILIPLLIFLGGGYMKLPENPVFNIISKISPLDWINKALFETIYSSRQSYFLPAVGICLGAGLLLLGLAMAKAVRRKKI